MKAMLFAAGLGTRLQPFTFTKPKALLPLKGIPLLELAIRRLKYYGFTEIMVNVHHFADQIISFLAEKEYFGIQIQISDETDLLLDTGGGLKKVSWFFDDQPFLVANADILTSLNLSALYTHHCKTNHSVTLAVSRRFSTRQLSIDASGLLCGWKNHQTGKKIYARSGPEETYCSFSGVHFANPAIFAQMPNQEVFPILPFYLSLAKEGSVGTYDHSEDYWFDLGRLENVPDAEHILHQIPGI